MVGATASMATIAIGCDRTRAGTWRHATHVKQQRRDKLIEHRRYVGEHVRDMADTEDWS